MISLSAPSVTFSQLFDECSALSSEAVKTSLEAEKSLLLSRAEAYTTSAFNQTLHELEEREPVYTTSQSLQDLYGTNLTSTRLRQRYSFLKATPKNQCPYCGFREVKTLDHYLPKSVYPDYSVHPLNLIPCCRDCNTSKLAKFALQQGDLAFHPYVDSWSAHVIIVAAMTYDPQAEIYFGTMHQDDSVPELIRRRAGAHFDLFELSSLYSTHANSELTERKHFFVETFISGGSAALQEELVRELASRRAANPNSWQSAMYRCLVGNERFLNGGCLLIPDPNTP